MTTYKYLNHVNAEVLPPPKKIPKNRCPAGFNLAPANFQRYIILHV